MLITEPADHIEYLYTPLELTLFLINYSFILNDNATEGKILKQDFYPHGGIFIQNSNGARYLDPKYSRWLSTDPALGEYMSGSDAGCGGAYNPVNMSLYHYAGNNPVKYTDPDGRSDYERKEKPQFVKKTEHAEFLQFLLGDAGSKAYWNASIFTTSGDRSGSFIGDIIFYEESVVINPFENRKTVNTFVHEIWHQVQYDTDPKIFSKLVDEFVLNERVGKFGLKPDIKFYDTNSIMGGSFSITPVGPIKGFTYIYNEYTLSDLMTLSDLPYYEAQAQFVGDFGSLVYEGYYNNGLDKHQKDLLKQMATIMKNSGYDTGAVKWVLNEME